MAQTKKKSEHYVNNKEFLAAMVEYKKIVNKAKRNKLKNPPVPDYIGECFLKIANHLSYRPNFINYTYKEEMISDGIENCLQYINNFNPEKSSNPFAYFTQIIYYAFIRRIQKEKKQLYIKYKTMDTQAAMSENVEISQNDTEQRYSYETMTQDQKVNMYNFISNFEESKKKKKETAKKKTTKVDDSTNLELIMSV